MNIHGLCCHRTQCGSPTTACYRQGNFVNNGIDDCILTAENERQWRLLSQPLLPSGEKKV